MNYTKEEQKRTETSIKTMKLKDEVGMGGPKSTQIKQEICRDNHVHYTSLHLLFEYRCRKKVTRQ